MTQRKISDAVRALEMMANNAKMAEHLRAEVRRIAQELREVDTQPEPDSTFFIGSEGLSS